MLRLLWILLLVLPLSACFSMGPHPYGSSSFSYLDLAPDGSKLAAVSQDGTSKVWDLTTRKVIHGIPGFDPSSPFGGYVAEFLMFRGETGEVVGDCGFGRICTLDLATGSQRLLLEHDPQDQAMAGLSSRDGRRLVFGTRRGAIFAFDTEASDLRYFKPIDRWSVGSPPVIYTLEGSPDLSILISATSEITAAVLYYRKPTTILRKDEGWIEVHARYMVDKENVWREPLWRGICVWKWEGGEPELIDDGFSDKIRADFSADGREFVIHQQGSSKFLAYRSSDAKQSQDLSDPYSGISWGADGLRYLEKGGRFLGILSYSEKSLMIVDRGNGQLSGHVVPLRNWSAGGRRPMVTFPEKQWIFIGLRDGGVDWYQFSAAPAPSLRHVATLR